SRHDAVGGCTHQDRVVRFWLLSQPRQVLGSFKPPPARPAHGSRVAIERSDEVDKEFWHRSVLVLGSQVAAPAFFATKAGTTARTCKEGSTHPQGAPERAGAGETFFSPSRFVVNMGHRLTGDTRR